VKRLTPQVEREVQLLLDRVARRILDERLASERKIKPERKKVSARARDGP
jgi:hypothetical protein